MIKMFLKWFPAVILNCFNFSNLAIENIALRQQLAVMKRSVKRPKLRRRDRVFWVLVSRFWGQQVAGSGDHCQAADRGEVAQKWLQAFLEVQVPTQGQRPASDQP